MRTRDESRLRSTAVAVLGALALLFAPPATLAQSGETTSTDAGAEPSQPPWYDTGHDYVAERLQRTAKWFDSFFGDPRADLETDASAYLHVTLDGFFSGVPDQSDYKVRVRGGADLPHFENRLRLILTSDADAALTGRDLAGTTQDETQDTDSGIGLRYLFRDRPGHKFSLGGGLSGGLSPNVLLAARYRYTRQWSQAAVSHVAPTLYWKSEDGFGVSTLVDFEWSQDEDTLWRYTLFGDYKEDIRGFYWSTQGRWARRLDSKSAVGLRGGIKGQTELRDILEEGWLKILYRRNFLRPWLFYEVEPGLSWHESVAYRTEPTLALRLEVQFYRDD